MSFGAAGAVGVGGGGIRSIMTENEMFDCIDPVWLVVHMYIHTALVSRVCQSPTQSSSSRPPRNQVRPLDCVERSTYSTPSSHVAQSNVYTLTYVFWLLFFFFFFNFLSYFFVSKSRETIGRVVASQDTDHRFALNESGFDRLDRSNQSK